jgi:hypothetical protein
MNFAIGDADDHLIADLAKPPERWIRTSWETYTPGSAGVPPAVHTC